MGEYPLPFAITPILLEVLEDMLVVKYQLPVTTLTLDFRDTAFNGAEVKCKTDVSMGFLFNMQKLAASTDVEAVEAGLLEFGNKVLIEWNLQGDDLVDIPANGKGMMAVNVMFAQLLMGQWAEAVAQPSAPLPHKSNNGSTDQTSPEIGSMMETPESLDLASLSRRN